MSCKPKNRRSLPFADWPERDRALWQAAAHPDPFAIIPLPLAKWRPSQCREAAKNYGTWLRYLQTTEPSLLALPLDERMTAARLGQFCAARQGQVEVATLAKCVADLYGIMLSLAPNQDWAWLKQLRHLICSHAKRQLPKTKAFTHAAELLRVGQELIAAAFTGTGKIEDPIGFRDGLIILLLILVPVRITQFSLIQLDQHLMQGQDGDWRLHWEAGETKTNRAATHPVPPELVEILRLYIGEVRPKLLARAKPVADTAALWIGARGPADQLADPAQDHRNPDQCCPGLCRQPARLPRLGGQQLRHRGSRPCP